MSFSPTRSYVQYRPDIQHFTPFWQRKYVLTHSDQTGDLFLTVSKTYAMDQVNEMRDEVLGKWIVNQNRIEFRGEVFVGNEDIARSIQNIRYNIFNKEMPTALQGIFYGERWLLEMQPFLTQSPIYILFKSNHPEFRGYQSFGYVKDYLKFS
ncbi:staygreen family protein [Pontibacillus yanchengensis]|uniref:Staygreen protein domain-containing protein n=1 Tax=Pontibacillus yanchengensis Y32 TaxID=1385514 RepID=A0A0A2T5N9_9BACI|nr:staygreen family protein [Pontibacillus yanchengensis]KGP70779.1 hypothetical protein N782_04325 [Pontibacillus yanchengensis Y32]